MKNFLLLSLVVILLLSLTACSKESIYEPFEDWANEYNAGKMLSDSKLSSFEKEFAGANRCGMAFSEYVLNNNINVQEYGEIELIEGKQLKNGDYAVVTENRTINFCPIVIRFKVVNRKTVEIIDISPVKYLGPNS